MRAVILIIALIGAAVAAPRNHRRNVQRIVGGVDTDIESYPYMSNMQYGGSCVFWQQACGGALISTTTVLSAAHCYHGDPASSWRVILGSSHASTGGTQYTVSRVTLHEEYDSDVRVNDLAIVTLATAATLSATVNLARIPGPTYDLVDHSIVTAIGWGAMSYGGPLSQHLQQVDILTLNQQECAERFEDLKTDSHYDDFPDITSGMLCAGVLDVSGKDVCEGDSGGPLVYQDDIIVGVASWSYDGCADATYPSINARTTYYSQWIQENGGASIASTE